MEVIIKFNFEELRDKTVAVINRIGRKGTVIICAVMLVGFAVILNIILYPGDSDGAKSNLSVDLDALSVNGMDSEQGEDNAAPVYNYFESMQLSRQQARDEAMEVLLSVAESETAIADMKNEALESIAQIDADLLYRCYHTFYNLHNMVLSVAGNVKAEEVLELCAQ